VVAARAVCLAAKSEPKPTSRESIGARSKAKLWSCVAFLLVFFNNSGPMPNRARAGWFEIGLDRAQPRTTGTVESSASGAVRQVATSIECVAPMRLRKSPPGDIECVQGSSPESVQRLRERPCNTNWGVNNERAIAPERRLGGPFAPLPLDFIPAASLTARSALPRPHGGYYSLAHDSDRVRKGEWRTRDCRDGVRRRWPRRDRTKSCRDGQLSPLVLSKTRLRD